MVAYLLFMLFMIVCVLLIVVVLLQKGRGGGLSAAFGGMGASAFGTRIGDVFTWVTIVLTGLFILLTITTTLVFRPPPEQVAIPRFDPAPGKYEDTTYVTITCLTPQARIYYTLDGQVPTKESLPYELQVRVEDQTLMARAFRSGGWQDSPVAKGYYGPTPPQVTTLPATAPVGAAPVTMPSP